MTVNVSVSHSAIDFHALNQLRAAELTDKLDEQEALRQVAGQFEALFVQMMLQSMRQAKLGDGIFDSSQSKLYQDMADQQLAADLAKRGGLGLQDMIMRQLGSHIGQEYETGRTFNLDNVVVRPALGAQINKQVVEQIQRVIPVSGEQIRSTSASAMGFSSPEDFVEKLWPMAKRAAEKLAVAPEVILSQAALETGWGQHVLSDKKGNSSFNLFNIKADASWQGEHTTVKVLEYRHDKAMTETSNFRQYDSYQQSFDDYVKFLQTQPRYREALQHAHDPETFIDMLHKAGYATDPHYADKIKRIMKGDTLAQISLEDRYG